MNADRQPDLSAAQAAGLEPTAREFPQGRKQMLAAFFFGVRGQERKERWEREAEAP